MSAPRLHQDEKVVFSARPGSWVVWSRYILTLGLYEFWRRATHYTVTDQRAILSRGLLLTKSQRAVPIDMIQDASIQTSMGAGYVLISTAGGVASMAKFGPMPSETARQMSDVILEQRKQARRA